MFTVSQSSMSTRRPAALAVASALLAISGCGSSGSNQNPLSSATFDTTLTRVAMRDGVELYTEVLLPSSSTGTALPTLLLRTPYDLPTIPLGGLAPAEDEAEDEDEDEDETEEDPDLTRAAWQPILDRGYAVVFQNVRGTQGSGGVNNLFAHAREDGVDTLDWIRQQPWSNGRVGALGDSAAGFSVHLLAAEQPEGLEATFSQVSCGDIWDSSILPEHGGLKLETILTYALGQSLEVGDEHLVSLGLGEDALADAQSASAESLGALFGDDLNKQFAALTVQPFTEYPGLETLLPRWREVLDEATRGDLAGYYDTRGQSAVPGMHVTLWQDLFVECALGDFQSQANAATEQRLLVLDGSHYDIDDADTWPILPMLDFFDRHLKDIPMEDAPTVQYAVQSAASTEVASKVLNDATSWPPLGAAGRQYYLDTQGVLSDVLLEENSRFSIASDPMNPQNTVGGRNLVIEAGVADQPPLSNDGATAVFATSTFTANATIAGEVTLTTSLDTDLADTDIHARLVELTDDGRRVLIVNGMKRARFQSGALSPMNLVAGAQSPLDVSLGNIAHQVAAGSRLQLEITTSNFPAWDLNPQTGGSAFTATTRQAGTVTLTASPATPSTLTIPFLP